MKNYLLNIFLLLIIIIVFINLYKLIKNKNIENFNTGTSVNTETSVNTGTSVNPQIDIDENTIDRIVNFNLMREINNIKSLINDKTPSGIVNRVNKLYNDTEKLYNTINNNKNVCENSLDDTIRSITDNYNSKNSSQIIDSTVDILKIKNGLKDCAEKCNNNKYCTSFSHNKDTNDCLLSSLAHIDNNISNIRDYNSKMFTKKSLIDSSLKNYNIDIDTQCKNYCHDDIINIGSNINNISIDECSQKCSDRDACKSFEYNLTDNECVLRSQCQRGTHLESSNKFNCDTGQIVEGDIIDTIYYDRYNYDTSNKKLLKYNLDELRDSCSKQCMDNLKCSGFTYNINENNNECVLYNDKLITRKDITKDLIDICKKPKIVKKNLYTKKNAEIEVTSCDAICEAHVNTSQKYIKFYKNLEDKNYSYITFENMYNIKQNNDFKFNEYNYIEVKYGFKAVFKSNENSISTLIEHSNPDQFNLGQSILRQDIRRDADNQLNWKDKVNVIEIQELEVYCRGEISDCKYKEDENGKPIYYKKFELYYGDEDDLQKCFEKKKEEIGEEEANKYYAPLLNDMICDPSIDKVKGIGNWSICKPISNNNYKFQKKWIIKQKSFGDNSTIDRFGNNIHTENISGCGYGNNQGFNNENIYVNCNPYNDKFINNGNYFKTDPTDGINKYYNNNGSEITNIETGTNAVVGTGTNAVVGTGTNAAIGTDEIDYNLIGDYIIKNPGSSCSYCPPDDSIYSKPECNLE